MKMPVKRLLQSSKLPPADIENLNKAFCKALRALDLVNHNDPIAEMVARKIIAIGATGVRDPAMISEIAIRRFKTWGVPPVDTVVLR